MQISLIASSNRPELWSDFLNSLDREWAEIEVVFAGPVKDPGITADNFRYINTADIKPAQCYEIARRHAIGEVVVWVADDCEFVGSVLSRAFEYWKNADNEKLILSLQTRETGYGARSGYLFPMESHRFFAERKESPLMAPLGMMSRKWLDELGGLDRRYICGQYENDIVMRACSDGGAVEIFGDSDMFVDIDHLGKSLRIGESKDESDFLLRPFASGYQHDRNILESTWWTGIKFRQSPAIFEPYKDKDLLTVNQSFAGRWA